MRRRSLPQVVIPVPCHVDWNMMTRIDSDGRARFCESCERPVYDSAAMTRDELFDLITRNEGTRPCMQLHRRPDGTIVTRDCFAPFARAGRFLWLKIALAAAAFWSWALELHQLTELSRRDAASRFSSEEISPPRRETDFVEGGLIMISPTAPKAPASMLARTPRSDGPSLLPAADRAPPLRTLEAEEEIWNLAERKLDD
jgi:hypothetical protein